MRDGAALRLIEAAYDLRSDEVAWLANLADVARAFDGEDLGVLVGLYELGEVVRASAYATTNDAGRAFEQMDRAALEIVPLVHRYSTCETSSEAAAAYNVQTAADAAWKAALGDTCVRDSLNIQGTDGARSVCVMVALRETLRVPAGRRALFKRVGVHLAAALRLRQVIPAGRRIDGAAFVFSANDAKLVHAAQAADAGAEEQLRAAARRRLDGRRQGDNVARAVDLWKGLVAGRWSLVETFDTDGRRFWVAHENAPGVVEDRRLTRREAQVFALAASGHGDSLIAYAMGLSPSTVRAHLARASAKLGARGAAALRRLTAHLGAELTLG